MWKGNYGKEPFDLRLAVLRLVFNLHWIVLITVAGTLLFGGGYYVKNVLLQSEKTYMATSTFKVEYADPDWAQNGTYINYMTWNTWVQSKEFVDVVKGHLEEQGQSVDFTQTGNEVILTAKVDSDLRVPAVMVTAKAPEICLAVAKAVEETMVLDFPKSVPNDVAAIRVIDPALEAPEVIPDVRPMRAFILSGILTGFFTIVIFLLKEWGEDSIWLPSTLHKRYGLCVVEKNGKAAAVTDQLYYFRDMKKIAVCSIDKDIDVTEVSKYMCYLEENKEQQGQNECMEVSQCSVKNRWISAPALLLCSEVCDTLRQADGILLVVKAGHHTGKSLEFALQYLEQQDCEVTGAILWDANEKLLNLYYGFDRIL